MLKSMLIIKNTTPITKVEKLSIENFIHII